MKCDAWVLWCSIIDVGYIWPKVVRYEWLYRLASVRLVSVPWKNIFCGGALFRGVIHRTITSLWICAFLSAWSKTGRWLALPKSKERYLLIPYRLRVSIWYSIYRLLNLFACDGIMICRYIWSPREFYPVLNFADFSVGSQKWGTLVFWLPTLLPTPPSEKSAKI